MATIGNIVIGMSARTDQLAKDLNTASTDLSAFGGKALAAAGTVDKIGASMNDAASRVDATTRALGRFQGASVAVGAAANAVGPAMAVASASIKEFAVVAKSASIVASGLAVVANGLSNAIRIVTAPFIALGKGIAYVAKNFGILGLVFGVAMAPLRPFIPMLRVFNATAGLTIVAVKGLAWAFGALRAVLSLNVKALAANAVKLAALGVALAITGAVKATAFAFNVLKSSLSLVAKAALPVIGTLGYVSLRAGKMADDAGDMADRLGTTTANLMALRYAAKLTGSETESLDGALAKMTVNLGKAAAEGGPTGDALSSIGLKAGDLARMDASKAFAAIAGELSKIDNPARRAALAMNIFGKGGVGILGTLNAGGAEIGRLTAEFEAFGAVSEAQRQGIGKLFDAFDKIGAVIAGVGARIASELSPYLAAAAEYFVGLATSAGGAGTAVAAGVSTMVEGIAKALDVVTLLNRGFLLVQQYATQAASYVVQGFAAVSSAVDAVRPVVGAVGSALAYIGDIAGQIGTVVGSAFAGVVNAVGSVASWLIGKAVQLAKAFGSLYAAIAGESQASELTKTLEAVKRGLDETAQSQADNLAKASGQTGLGDKARTAFAEIASKADAAAKAVDQTPKAFAAIEAAADGAEKATSKAFDAMKSDAERFVEAAMTPLEKFEAEQKRIKELAGAGLLDQTTVDRITAKGMDALNQDQAKASDSAAKNPFASAMEFGSQEARATILRASESTRTDNAGKKTADNTTKLVELQTKAVSVLDQLSRSLVSSGAAEVF